MISHSPPLSPLPAVRCLTLSLFPWSLQFNNLKCCQRRHWKMASIKHNGLNQSAPRILPAAAKFDPPPPHPTPHPDPPLLTIPASNELMLKYAEAQYSLDVRRETWFKMAAFMRPPDKMERDGRGWTVIVLADWIRSAWRPLLGDGDGLPPDCLYGRLLLLGSSCL